MPTFLISPLAWMVAAALLLTMARSRLPGAARKALIGVLAASLFLCTPLGANLLTRAIEVSAASEDPRCRGFEGTPWVVVSGGFARPPAGPSDYAALQPESWRRLRAGVNLALAEDETALVLTGRGPYRVPESRMLERLALDWGVPAARLQVEDASLTTWENARRLRTMGVTRARVVTSALHMRRTLLAFRRAGIEACARPSSWAYLSPRHLGALVPQGSSTSKSEAALYELFGWVAYRLRPSPAAVAQDPAG